MNVDDSHIMLQTIIINLYLKFIVHLLKSCNIEASNQYSQFFVFVFVARPSFVV